VEKRAETAAGGGGKGGGGEGETPWLPVARSGAPAARSTAKSTANAIECSLAVRERKGDRTREHVVLEPVGDPAERAAEYRTWWMEPGDETGSRNKKKRKGAKEQGK